MLRGPLHPVCPSVLHRGSFVAEDVQTDGVPVNTIWPCCALPQRRIVPLQAHITLPNDLPLSLLSLLKLRLHGPHALGHTFLCVNVGTLGVLHTLQVLYLELQLLLVQLAEVQVLPSSSMAIGSTGHLPREWLRLSPLHTRAQFGGRVGSTIELSVLVGMEAAAVNVPPVPRSPPTGVLVVRKPVRDTPQALRAKRGVLDGPGERLLLAVVPRPGVGLARERVWLAATSAIRPAGAHVASAL
mmetsp:Transcript_3409/g.8599  ORF Transcript_3409/g.8599 Transcript_3409/m.8599 type:complete len:242 (-) Transcript_3409:255-980(-)